MDSFPEGAGMNGHMITQIGGRTVFIDGGGPMHKISVGGKIIEFEMHWYCGPTILNKRTSEPLKHQPMDFLHAASLWAQQGKKVDENGLCIWFHEPEPITEHIVGKHYKIVGEHPPVRGE